MIYLLVCVCFLLIFHSNTSQETVQRLIASYETVGLWPGGRELTGRRRVQLPTTPSTEVYPRLAQLEGSWLSQRQGRAWGLLSSLTSWGKASKGSGIDSDPLFP